MPARSKSQQRLFGMVSAYKKGKLKHAPKKVKEVASHVSDEDAEHFARTKHDDLPEKKAFDISFAVSCLEKIAGRRDESFVGEGVVESFTPSKTEDHDEIVFRTKDGKRYRISNNTKLGRRLNATIGEKIRVHGSRVPGTNVVHKVHFNMHAPGGWIERLGDSEKDAAGVAVVVYEDDKPIEFQSLTEAAGFLVSKGSIPIAQVKEMLSQRKSLINGLKVEYPDTLPSEDQDTGVKDLVSMFRDLTGSYGASSYGM